MMPFQLARICLAFACFTAAMVLAAALLIFPKLTPQPYILYMLAAFAATLVIMPRRNWPRLTKGTICAAILALITWPFATIYIAFGQVDMISVLFHAEAGIAGANLTLMYEPISLTGFCLFILVRYAHWFTQWPRLWVVPWGLAAILILSNPLLHYKLQELTRPLPELDLNAMRVTPELKAPQVLPDILHIYLEGTDQRFFALSPKDSPDPAQDAAASALATLAQRGTSLNAIGQVAGTAWTMAGMVASQCGVPLMPRGALRNAIEGQLMTSFMPRVECLSDILHRQGYHMSFLMGALAEFAGTDSFYKTHGFQNVITFERLNERYPEDRVTSRIRGTFDDELVFKAAYDELGDRLAEPAPFLMTIATIGPHGVPNYLSKSCRAPGQPPEITAVAPSVACLMGLTQDFITKAEAAHAASARGRPLQIIVQSDHFHHRPLPWPDGMKPSNTVILIGAHSDAEAPNAAPSGQELSLSGSMLDIYPTLLDWLGFEWQGPEATQYKAGLGVSLISPKATEALAARYAPDIFDRIIMQNIPLFAELWQGSH